VVDRAEAIAAAVSTAKAGDAVVIVGKGHEPYQEVSGERRPFDDREQSRSALAACGYDDEAADDRRDR